MNFSRWLEFESQKLSDIRYVYILNFMRFALASCTMPILSGVTIKLVEINGLETSWLQTIHTHTHTKQAQQYTRTYNNNNTYSRVNLCVIRFVVEMLFATSHLYVLKSSYNNVPSSVPFYFFLATQHIKIDSVACTDLNFVGTDFNAPKQTNK